MTIDFISDRVKAVLYPIWPICFSYRQGNQKNILLFASRRSGSTYLARLITSDRGFIYIDQPFDLFRPNTTYGKIKKSHLPPLPQSQFIDLSNEQSQQVHNYVSLLLEGKLRRMHQLERWKFPFLANRILLKICNASPLIDWFNSNFDILTVYLIRHPIPQALSIIRNNWGITAKAYLQNDKFINMYLSSDQFSYAQEIISEGSYFQKAVVNWCLENIIPLKYCHSSIFLLTYEELVSQPYNIIPYLINILNLKSPKKMFDTIKVPSSSSAFSEEKTKNAIISKDSAYLINKWKNAISQSQVMDAQKILDTFGIYEYQAHEFMPSKQLLLF